jgi:hypothetical protein
MTFREQQEKIAEYLGQNYKNHLPGSVTEELRIITDFLDLDKYKYPFCLFMDFARLDFSSSCFDDDCGDIERLLLPLYLVRRDGQPSKLQADVLDAAYSFFEMLRTDPTLGIAQNTVINSIDFYKHVEANKYIVAAEINLTLEVEV